MNKDTAHTIQEPSFAHALGVFAVIFLSLAVGMVYAGVQLHVVMFICVVWVAANAVWLGHKYTDVRGMMNRGIAKALPALYIFILIGMVIAAFMHSGTIAALIRLGLDWLSPAWFLPVGLWVCCLMSLATGTSWGTVGTLGVVFMGLGEAMGLPLPLVAGMVISGATFGDKMSPVSDTTNLAALSAGTPLYRHIGSMLYTTVPSFVLVTLLFAWLGLTHSQAALPVEDIARIQSALQSGYALNPWICLLPLLLMLVLSLRRHAAEVTMLASVACAVLIAVLYQGSDPVTVLNALWDNGPGQTGDADLDERLLGRGGVFDMSWTLLLSILALAMGGVLHGTGLVQSLLTGLIGRIRRAGSLVASTIAAGVFGNAAMGEAYITIILNAQVFRPGYARLGLDRAVLSRSVEEGATLTTALIPWTTAGAFYAATLDMAVLDYLPYALFNWINPLLAIALAFGGWGLLQAKRTPDAGDGPQSV